MIRFVTGGFVCLAVTLMLTACHGKNEPDTASFKAAINDYYATRQECVWTSPLKFPVQADKSNDTQTKGFDALTDAGLLIRQAAEKKRFLIGSKQINLYDVSDKGRAAWTVDPSQPGYGNFCFGHRQVTSIDGFKGGAGADGVNTTSVSYRYEIAGVPAWAQSPETKMAFPAMQDALAGPKAASAKLVQTQNGWKVSDE